MATPVIKRDPRKSAHKPVAPAVVGQRVLQALHAGRGTLSDLYLADTDQRINAVRRGLPGHQVLVVFERALDASRDTVQGLLGISRATGSRMVRGDSRLGPDATQRALFIAGLVKMVEDDLPQSPEVTDFDAAVWVRQWLETPQPAIKGATPASYLDTDDGRNVVRRLLGNLLAGTYA